MAQINDFVGVFDDAFAPAFCDAAVQVFASAEAKGLAYRRNAHENSRLLHKDTTSAWILADSFDANHSSVSKAFTDKFFKEIMPAYVGKYDAIKEVQSAAIYELKIQRVRKTEGYHVWHYESTDRMSAGRFLAFILYLNDVDDGGETEFLYQSMRVKPKKGTLVLFPSTFTHTHRGNPPLSGDKYILNGWVEF
jgi:hypothetical protein